MPNWATSSPIGPLTGRGIGATDTAEFLATSAFGKVPVLRYLAGWQANALWPADPAGRSLADRWMDWASISLTSPLTRPRKAEAEADLAAVIKAVEALDAWLARQPYLAGETLSLADIVAAPLRCITGSGCRKAACPCRHLPAAGIGWRRTKVIATISARRFNRPRPVSAASYVAADIPSKASSVRAE